MNQRTRLTKLTFRKALAQLMKDKHISQISIREICEKAELNRSTFYLHYKNVYDLLEEIENEIAAEADKAIDFKKESQIRFLKYLRENKDYYHILLTSNDFNFMRKYHEKVLDKLMKIMNLGVSENRQKYILSYALEGSMCVVRKWSKTASTKALRRSGRYFRSSPNPLYPGFPLPSPSKYSFNRC